jgi:hypothetical protein
MHIKHNMRSVLFCGPAAISAATGLRTSVVCDMVQRLRGNQKPVTSMSGREVVDTVECFNFRAEGIWCPHISLANPTLVQFQRHFRDLITPFPTIVNLKGHFVVLQGDHLVDTWTKAAVPFAQAPHRRRRVEYAWRIIPLR